MLEVGIIDNDGLFDIDGNSDGSLEGCELEEGNLESVGLDEGKEEGDKDGIDEGEKVGNLVSDGPDDGPDDGFDDGFSDSNDFNLDLEGDQEMIPSCAFENLLLINI